MLRRLSERIGNPLNWRSVSRCQFFTVNALLFFVSTSALSQILLAYPEEVPYFAPEGLRLFRSFAMGAAAAWLVLGVASLWLRHRKDTSSPVLIHATIQLSAVCFAISAYIAGPYTSPVMLIYLLFVCGLVLFSWRAVMYGVATAASILTATTLAEQLGWFTSAPLFSSSPLQNGQVGWVWLLISGVISSFFIASALLIVAYVVVRWRDREARYRDLSTTDHLTRVANRRHMMEHLELCFSRALDQEQPIACVMIDIDHFKRVNDNHGHLCGDNVLVEVARILGEEVRATDIVARYGGEEFAIILPGADLAGAHTLAERCRRRIEATEIPVGEGALQITASMGLAGYPEHPMESYEELLRLADDALYQAKNSGRNRVVMH